MDHWWQLQPLWMHVQAAIEQLPAATSKDAPPRMPTRYSASPPRPNACCSTARGRIRGMVDALVGDAPAPAVRPASLTRRRPHASPLGRCLDDALSRLFVLVCECLWTGGTA